MDWDGLKKINEDIQDLTEKIKKVASEDGDAKRECGKKCVAASSLVDAAKEYDLDNDVLGDVVNLFYEHLMVATQNARNQAKIDAIRRLCLLTWRKDPYGIGLDIEAAAAVVGFDLPEKNRGESLTFGASDTHISSGEITI